MLSHIANVVAEVIAESKKLQKRILGLRQRALQDFQPLLIREGHALGGDEVTYTYSTRVKPCSIFLGLATTLISRRR